MQTEPILWGVGPSLVDTLGIKLKYKRYKVHLACQHPRRHINVEQPLSLSKMRR